MKPPPGGEMTGYFTLRQGAFLFIQMFFKNSAGDCGVLRLEGLD